MSSPTNYDERIHELIEQLITALGGAVPGRSQPSNYSLRTLQLLGGLQESLLDALAAAGGSNALTLEDQPGSFYLNRLNHTGVNDASLLQGSNASYYLNRLNHTGSQAIATVTSLQTELNNRLLLATAQTITARHTINPSTAGAPFVLGANAQQKVINLDADKLDGQDGTFYQNRANHTGSQAIATVTGLQALLDKLKPQPGFVQWIAYEVTGNPHTDPYGYKWYVPDGSSIGNVGSGAAIASSEMQLLFQALWATAAYTIAGGKGASAAADWSAAKVLVIPDVRGRSPVMAGQGAGLTNRAVGSTGGTEQEFPSVATTASHRHNHIEGSGSLIYKNTGGGVYGFASGIYPLDSTSLTRYEGGGQPHNNMQPWHSKTELWAMGV